MKAVTRIALVLGSMLLVPPGAHAAWSTDPVTVHATTDACPLVAAASDAEDGAIVVWQQDDAADPAVHRLLAKRLLANGDVDPSWPADGAPVSDVTVGRTALGALGDGGGGAYVWWMEYAALYLTRILSDGSVAPGWPARGKYLGVLCSDRFRPLVFADAQGGIWLGWLANAPLFTSGRVVHLGPDGLGAEGWPDHARAYAASTLLDEALLATFAFTFAPAPDGGAWVAWGDGVCDSTLHEGSWRLLRVGATGLVAPGWDGAGLPVRAFHCEVLLDAGIYDLPFAASPVAAAADGVDGVYLLLSDQAVDCCGWVTSTPKLFHLDATGSPVPSWPADGVEPYSGSSNEAVDRGAEYSLRLFPEAAGGVFALRPAYYTENQTSLDLFRFTPAAAQSGWSTVPPPRFECIVLPSGDTYLASSWPYGPLQRYDPVAYVCLNQTSASGTPGPGFHEWHEEIMMLWFGDIGLAPTGDAGAIFVWSQVRERHGVFARRFCAAGEVTGVPSRDLPGGGLRLRFAPGSGVVVTLGAVAGGRIRLLDVSGRACGGAEVPAGARQVTLEGTAALAPGLYFARHRGADGTVETGRVVVVR